MALDKNDRWEPTGRELITEDIYYEAAPGQLNALDEGWDRIATDKDLLATLDIIGERGVMSTEGLSEKDALKADAHNAYLWEAAHKIATNILADQVEIR